MHIRWQARQVVKIDRKLHVDRNAIFGSCASGQIWCLLFDSILWVAIHEYDLADLLAYVNDVFGYNYNPILDFYEPYGRSMLKKQAALCIFGIGLAFPMKIISRSMADLLKSLGL
jgi:hypothetical protein